MRMTSSAGLSPGDTDAQWQTIPESIPGSAHMWTGFMINPRLFILHTTSIRCCFQGLLNVSETLQRKIKYGPVTCSLHLSKNLYQ